MNVIELIAVLLGLLSLVGQAANYLLHLKLRTAILESEQKTLEKVEAHYVREETCEARMRNIEQRY